MRLYRNPMRAVPVEREFVSFEGADLEVLAWGGVGGYPDSRIRGVG